MNENKIRIKVERKRETTKSMGRSEQGELQTVSII